MDQWFYNESGEQRGPVSEEQLKALITDRKIPSDSLVWRDGMQDWKPATAIPGFEISPYAPPASDPLSHIDHTSHGATGSQVRPWVRYWARTFDLLGFVMIAGIAFAIISLETLERYESLISYSLFFVYNFIEPVFLAVFGTTPGKAILCIRVRNADGSKLTYFQALGRTFSVWLRGQGLNIPLVALITAITAYSRLKNDGSTSWDQVGGFIIVHRKISWWRWILFCLPLLGFFALIVAGNS